MQMDKVQNKATLEDIHIDMERTPRSSPVTKTTACGSSRARTPEASPQPIPKPRDKPKLRRVSSVDSGITKLSELPHIDETGLDIAIVAAANKNRPERLDRKLLRRDTSRVELEIMTSPKSKLQRTHTSQTELESKGIYQEKLLKRTNSKISIDSGIYSEPPESLRASVMGQYDKFPLDGIDIVLPNISELKSRSNRLLRKSKSHAELQRIVPSDPEPRVRTPIPGSRIESLIPESRAGTPVPEHGVRRRSSSTSPTTKPPFQRQDTSKVEEIMAFQRGQRPTLQRNINERGTAKPKLRRAMSLLEMSKIGPTIPELTDYSLMQEMKKEKSWELEMKSKEVLLEEGKGEEERRKDEVNEEDNRKREINEQKQCEVNKRNVDALEEREMHEGKEENDNVVANEDIMAGANKKDEEKQEEIKKQIVEEWVKYASRNQKSGQKGVQDQQREKQRLEREEMGNEETKKKAGNLEVAEHIELGKSLSLTPWMAAVVKTKLKEKLKKKFYKKVYKFSCLIF